MRALSVIGTRPQYIKIKPIYDYCKKNKIDHYILDTRQHYSHNVSGSLIEDLGLNIDFSLSLKRSDEIDFISDCTKSIRDILEKVSPDIVLVYGDTNSTFCAALAAYKVRIPIAHIEAGERCFDTSVPEEVTRKFVDNVSTFNFCSSKGALANLDNAILCGDLEYEALSSIDPNIEFHNFAVMTIHRQSNCNKKSLGDILSFCSEIPLEIRFFAHHRTIPLLPSILPDNISIYESCPYSEMVESLSKCSFVITDSGGLQKTSAFFGKKTLIMRENTEWKEAEQQGFARLATLCQEDADWLMSGRVERDKLFYLNKESGCMPSEIIFSKLKDLT